MNDCVPASSADLQRAMFQLGLKAEMSEGDPSLQLVIVPWGQGPALCLPEYMASRSWAKTQCIRGA